MARNTNFIIAIVLIVFAGISCTNDTNEFIPVPTPEQTESLEAGYTTQSPNSLTSPYWSVADYVVIPVAEITTGQVEGANGFLNMNGMYNGLEDFNSGADAELTLRAAYDDVNVYILVTWQDDAFNISQGNWLYNGPEDPLKKGEDRFGWTSQQNDDNLIFSFEKNTSDRDIWKWSLALSEPVGYALDMFGNDMEYVADSGKKSYVRNLKDENDERSGPKYQWNGQNQEVNRKLGGSTILDPAFYLTKTTGFSGDIIKGESVYQVACGFCHGKGGDGNGSYQNSQVPLNIPGWLNRYTLQQMDNIIGNEGTHTGARYWNGLKEDEKANLSARLKAFAGIPGYILQMPDGSNADIKSLSNVQLSRIDYEGENPGYSVLLIRKLNTGHDDDVSFSTSTGMPYKFNIYLTDNDGLNLVGALDNELIFVK